VTYPAAKVDTPDAVQERVFDPALKHYSRAFRLGEPVFEDPEVGARWRTNRLQAMDHLLRVASTSPWKDHLVLRGSVLLKAWLGEAAREPGDMDWVVSPKNLGIDDPLAREMIEGLVRLAADRPRAGETRVEAARIAVDDIWTYERVPGRRVVFPWTAANSPPGSVQMDFVFGEDLWSEPILTPIPTHDGDSVIVWAATKEVALAWKLLWLETDSYPQGKDLYDATLLAEQSRLPLSLLDRVLRASEYPPARGLEPDFTLEWSVDWDSFKSEYPWVPGEAADWQARLTAALKPMFGPGK
jgi:hypothetical protein